MCAHGALNNQMLKLGKYSIGIGDRFGHQGKAQLKALISGRQLGVELTPVWNKSNREHQIIGTQPEAVREEADQSVHSLDYKGLYFVDADHITLETVNPFLTASDFFTLDVAGYIGKQANADQVAKARVVLGKLGAEIDIPGINNKIVLDEAFIDDFLNNYLFAIHAAFELYQYILKHKGISNFVPEVSMDEVENPQSPRELLLILVLLADLKVPVQTIAPKFSGRFNKGVDYVGDINQFKEEFESDLMVIKYAIEKFGLPEDLKLSVHSGSDKFSIYPIMGDLIRKHDAGIHIKTAGTTWLEEVIGLSLGDQDSIEMIKGMYKEAYQRQDELCRPYADVIDIDASKLPVEIDDWTGEQIAQAIRHIPDNPAYNSSMRQLFHVGYKLAAERGSEYLDALKKHKGIIAQQVEENLYDRHLKRLF